MFLQSKLCKLAFEIIKLKFGDLGYLSMHGIYQQCKLGKTT